MADFSLAPIYPITSLSKDPKTVKEEARNSVVREREDAKYEAYLTAAIEQGINDVETGRYVTSRAEMFAEATKRRKQPPRVPRAPL